MKCEQCAFTGLTSTITEMPHLLARKNYFPSFDEDGGRHYHDQNRNLRTYKCSNGHVWSLEMLNKCWCGWESATSEGIEALMPSLGRTLVPKIVDKFEE